MDQQNTYLELMASLKTKTNDNNEFQQREADFNNNYKQNHPAQTELISWLVNWRDQHGVAGKRKPLERDESLQQIQQVQPLTQRRKVVVRKRKLIDDE